MQGRGAQRDEALQRAVLRREGFVAVQRAAQRLDDARPQISFDEHEPFDAVPAPPTQRPPTTLFARTATTIRPGCSLITLHTARAATGAAR